MAAVLEAGRANIVFVPAAGFSLDVNTALALATSFVSEGSVVNISLNTINSTSTRGGGQVNADGAVVVEVSFEGLSASTLPVSSTVRFALVIDAGVYLSSDCPSLFNASHKLSFSCDLTSLKKQTNAPLRSATQTTFQSSTTASGLLMNPVTAMTNTGMISILSLQQCVFSDVEPLDPSMSPLGVSMGQEAGQYYRGAVVAGFGVYASALIAASGTALLLRIALKMNDSFELLRLPSVLMVPVSIFHQGLVSSGTTLVRLALSSSDICLGLAAIGLGMTSTAVVLLATTRYLSVRIAKRHDSADDVDGAEQPLRYEKMVPGLKQFLRLAMWEYHWVNGIVPGWKRRYLLLIDDLCLPWWTAAELSSGMVQASLLACARTALLFASNS